MGEATGRIERPRITALLDRIPQGSIIFLRTQHRGGIATAVRHWADLRGLSVVWWSSTRDDVPGPGSPDADVVVVRLADVSCEDADAVIACRRRWPDATFLVESGVRWPPQLLESGLKPQSVLHGRVFGFTPAEIVDRAAQLGLALDTDEAQWLIDQASSQVGFADAVIRAAAARGVLDEVAVREGCDVALGFFAEAAASGVIGPDTWELCAAIGRVGDVTPSALHALSAHSELTALVAEGLVANGLIVEKPELGLVGAPPALRDSIVRMLAGNAAMGGIDERIGALALQLLDHGRADDAWSLVSDLPHVRTRVLTERWWLLDGLPVGETREWLEHATRSGADPRARLALARALVDVTSVDHDGRIPPADRAYATLLLDEAAGGELDAVAAVAVDVMRGVLLRLGGRFDEAMAHHERVCASIPPAPGTPAERRIACVAQVHAGISALDASAPDVAAQHLTAAASVAHQAGVPHLAVYAHELLRVVAAKAEPHATSYQTLVDNLVGGSAVNGPIDELQRLWTAMYALDIGAMQAELSEPSALVDDPLSIRMVLLATRAAAHGILQHGGVALGEVEYTESEMQGFRLTGLHQAMLAWARAEGLIHTGRAGEADAMLAALPAAFDGPIPVALLRARALLAAGDADRAGEVLGAEPRHASGVLRVWEHAIRAEVHRRRDEAEGFSRTLAAGFVSAARSRAMLPFALQGIDALAAAIDGAADLPLDVSTRHFVAQLAAVRDELRRAGAARLTLSERERRVLTALVATASTRDLAEILGLSPNTVKTHLKNIYRKLGVSSRAAAIVTARRLSLLPDDPSGTPAPLPDDAR